MWTCHVCSSHQSEKLKVKNTQHCCRPSDYMLVSQFPRCLWYQASWSCFIGEFILIYYLYYTPSNWTTLNPTVNSLISQFHNHAQNVQAVVLAGHTSCKIDGLYDWGEIMLKTYYNWYILLYFIKYFHTFIQSAVFTGRVARQNNGLYVLRMIVKLAYKQTRCPGFKTPPFFMVE